jgi:hypothetical protein
VSRRTLNRNTNELQLSNILELLKQSEAGTVEDEDEDSDDV